MASALLRFLFLVTPLARAKKKHTQPAAPFDYYLLSLSWAPNFCASHQSDHSSECAAGNHAAFVLHGLWPQSNSRTADVLRASQSRGQKHRRPHAAVHADAELNPA